MWQKAWQNKLVIALCAGVLLRASAVTLPGQPYDIGTYQAWGALMLEKGPTTFFATTWSDYLPLPIYAMSAITWLSLKLSVAFPLLFKLTIVVIELGLLWKLSRFTSPILLLLSPALLGDGALWGQIDILPALLALLALFNVDRRYLSGIYFGLSLALKPIFILVAPILLVLSWRRRTTPTNIISSALVVVISAIPVFPNFSVFSFLYDKVIEQASTYPYRTINAFNFWNLGNPLNLWPPDNVSYLGLSAHSAGLIIFSLLGGIAFWTWLKRPRPYHSSPRLFATLLILFFTFTTRMHERHLIFGLIPLMVAFSRDLTLLPALSALTLSFCLNLWGAYYWVLHNQTWPFPYAVAQLASWLTVISSLSLLVWDWSRVLASLKVWLKSNLLLSLIILLSLTLRLVSLDNPPKYIFDEVYHAFTARELLHNHKEAWEWWTTPPPGVAYEWTHPPLAKYGMGLGMLIFGENSFGWRVGSALFGTSVVLASYLLCNELFRRRRLALTASFLVAISGLNLAQSRLAMNDIYMLAFMLWSLFGALRGNWRLSAVLFGLSLASKWSALYGLLPLTPIYLHSFSSPLSSKWRYFLVPLRFLAISALVYLVTYLPFLSAGHTWQDLLELHRQMWYYHTHLVATHAYGSTPWQWILDLRPVWYFVEYGDMPANIYALDNPFVLWLGLSALAISFLKLRDFRQLFILVGYLSFVLPWLASPRIMFFYHYLPSATFLCFALAAYIDDLSPMSRGFILALASLCFLAIAPLLFGISMPPLYTHIVFSLFPTWK